MANVHASLPTALFRSSRRAITNNQSDHSLRHVGAAAAGTASAPRSVYRAVRGLLSIAAIALAGSCIVAGCSSTKHRLGTIAGTAQPCIGPYIRNAHYTVDVTVLQDSRTVAVRKDLASPYRFQVRVPPGRYQVKAPADGSVAVTVRSAETVTVVLHNTCQ